MPHFMHLTLTPAGYFQARLAQIGVSEELACAIERGTATVEGAGLVFDAMVERLRALNEREPAGRC